MTPEAEEPRSLEAWPRVSIPRARSCDRRAASTDRRDCSGRASARRKESARLRDRRARSPELRARLVRASRCAGAARRMARRANLAAPPAGSPRNYVNRRRSPGHTRCTVPSVRVPLRAAWIAVGVAVAACGGEPTTAIVTARAGAPTPGSPVGGFPTAPGPVIGWIVDGRGQPISGVRVVLRATGELAAASAAVSGDRGVSAETPSAGSGVVAPASGDGGVSAETSSAGSGVVAPASGDGGVSAETPNAGTGVVAPASGVGGVSAETPSAGTGDGATVAGTVIAAADSDAEGAIRFPASARGVFEVVDRTLAFDAPHVFAAEVAWRPDRPPPRILLARRASIAARVADEHGAAVAGAEVRLSDGSAIVTATGTTGADGIARFADLVPGPYELWAGAPGAATPLARITVDGAPVDAPPPPIELALAPAGTVTGRVVTDGPTPATAAVALVPIELDHAVRVAPLDTAGGFALASVPPGRWRLQAAAPGYLPEARVVEVTAGTPRGPALAIALRRAASVAGTVVDATGAPIAGAPVVLRAHGAADPAEADRRRTVETSRPLRWIHPLAADARTGERQMPIRDSRRFGAARPGTRPAECGLGHCGNDLGTERGSVVHAAADGTVARAYTEIRHEAGRYVAIDHGDGITTYYMHLDELRPDLAVGQTVRAGEPIGTLGNTGFAKINPHLHFAISQEHGGRTWYVDPEPILEHAVVLQVARSLEHPDAMPDVLIAAARRDGAASATTRATRLVTDADGRFRVDDVAPGTYVAVAFDPGAHGLAPGLSSAFTVGPAVDKTGVAIILRPGAVVRGRVLGPTGAVRGARIVAGEGSGETAHQVASTYAGPDGEYVLRSLAGDVTLTVTAPGYGDQERAIDVDAATGTRREDFDLVREDAVLRGEVIGPDGGVAAGAIVRVVAGPTARRSTVTDAHGRFALPRVAAGEYTLAITAADAPELRMMATTDRTAEVRLAQGGSIEVDLRDAHTGAGIAAVRVDAAGPGGKTAAATTDAAGRAMLRGLIPGSWTVRARAAGYVGATETVAVRAERGAAATARLELARGAVLAGVVRDRYGERIAGARVSIGDAATTTDALGRFRLVDAPTGSRALVAEHAGRRVELPLDLAPGDEQITLELTLPD
jgi:murein DD-endopeptidase MepM/ murein hydrolase activator NlpD